MEKLNFPGYSTLVLSGNGYIIEGVGDELIQYYAVFTSNLKVEFNGEDVTDKVKTADKAQFLASKFMNDIYDGVFYYGDDEMELPKSIFLLPEGTEIEDIKLIPVNGDFRDWDKGGIVADFIDVDDKEQEAQSYQNNVKDQPKLPAFDYEGHKCDDNRDMYSGYYSEDNETSAYRI